MTENTDRLTELIRARVEPALKTAFKKHAKNRKLKESELLRRLVLRELGMDDDGQTIDVDPEPASVAPDRLTVRLAPVVMEAAKTKAKSQGMPPSRWVSALVQSNVTRHPVLLTDELRGVLASNRELAAIGRNINQIAKAINEAFHETERVRLDALAEVATAINQNKSAIRVLVQARKQAWLSDL